MILIESISEKMNIYIQTGFHSIGISIINDRNCDDLFYININPSKEIWTEMKNFNSNPIQQKLNQTSEKHYQTYLKDSEENSNDKDQSYEIDQNGVIHLFFSFHWKNDLNRMYHSMEILLK
jgi:hypothetical protein